MRFWTVAGVAASLAGCAKTVPVPEPQLVKTAGGENGGAAEHSHVGSHKAPLRSGESAPVGSHRGGAGTAGARLESEFPDAVARFPAATRLSDEAAAAHALDLFNTLVPVPGSPDADPRLPRAIARGFINQAPDSFKAALYKAARHCTIEEWRQIMDELSQINVARFAADESGSPEAMRVQIEAATGALEAMFTARLTGRFRLKLVNAHCLSSVGFPRTIAVALTGG